MTEKDFVGTWRLVSMGAHASDGEVTHPMGEDARGFIMYSPDGYMSVVIFSANRQRFGTSDIQAGDREQLAAAARTYISYAGRYEVREQHILHFVEASLFPDWVGTTQLRHYDFEGRRLTLSTDPVPLGGKQLVAALVWERVTKRS